MKKSDLTILLTAVTLVAGGVGFAIGHLTAPKATAASSSSGGYGSDNLGSSDGSGRRMFRGGRPTIGTITAISGDTATLTDDQGATKTITLTASTAYSSGDQSTTTRDDVKVGAKILALGTTSGDTVTATRIVINPTMPSGGQLQQGSGDSTSSSAAN